MYYSRLEALSFFFCLRLLLETSLCLMVAMFFGSHGSHVSSLWFTPFHFWAPSLWLICEHYLLWYNFLLRVLINNSTTFFLLSGQWFDIVRKKNMEASHIQCPQNKWNFPFQKELFHANNSINPHQLEHVQSVC